MVCQFPAVESFKKGANQLPRLRTMGPAGAAGAAGAAAGSS